MSVSTSARWRGQGTNTLVAARLSFRRLPLQTGRPAPEASPSSPCAPELHVRVGTQGRVVLEVIFIVHVGVSSLFPPTITRMRQFSQKRPHRRELQGRGGVSPWSALSSATADHQYVRSAALEGITKASRCPQAASHGQMVRQNTSRGHQPAQHGDVVPRSCGCQTSHYQQLRLLSSAAGAFFCRRDFPSLRSALYLSAWPPAPQYPTLCSCFPQYASIF